MLKENNREGNIEMFDNGRKIDRELTKRGDHATDWRFRDSDQGKGGMLRSW